VSVNFSVALRAPVAVGRNAIDAVQLSPGFSPPVAVQVCVMPRKSPRLVPSLATPVICSGALPTFVSVTVFGAVVVPTGTRANFRAWTLRSSQGPGVPVPESWTLCGLSTALSAMRSAAVLAPVSSGRNRTSAMHDWPVASVAPTHVPACHGKLSASRHSDRSRSNLAACRYRFSEKRSPGS